jgi:hypothetical protein
MLRPSTLAVALTLATAGALVGDAQAAATSVRIPIAFVDSTCSDPVALSGTLHAATTTVESPGGSVIVHVTFNPQGVTGIGLVSGSTYRGTGVTTQTITLTRGLTDTLVNNFRLLSPGAGGDVILQEILHVTIDADGTVKTEHVQTTVSCT